MRGPHLSVSRRTRRTPFTDRVQAAGVKSYTVYNRMLLPAFFKSFENDYRHLKRHVQVWDVSCERQVEITGPDSAWLLQKLTPRNLAQMQTGQCAYTPMVDADGRMLNDPVILKLAHDHWWVSVADSDLLLWINGLATGFGVDVQICEPHVSPLGVQGPKANELMARVFGDAIHKIRFFRFKRLKFRKNTFIIARSGYAKQGGFEIYVQGGPETAEPLWDALMSAGDDLKVRAGCPNLIERIEAGLLSYGNDMTRDDNPYECGLGRFCADVKDVDCIGREALIQAKDTLGRQIRGLMIDGDKVPACRQIWLVAATDGTAVGYVSSAAWSPDMKTNIAIAMIDKQYWKTGTNVIVQAPDRARGIKCASFLFYQKREL